MFENYSYFGIGMFWLVLVLITIAVFILTRPKYSSSPKDILERKYGNGEIDTKEYFKRLEKLEKA